MKIKGKKLLAISFFLSVIFLFGYAQKSAAAVIRVPATHHLGLVGYWTFDGPDVAGVTSFDRSGQGHHGTLINGPTRTMGRIGQALEFDGANDYVDISTSANPGSGSFSVTFWIKTSYTGTGGRAVAYDSHTTVGGSNGDWAVSVGDPGSGRIRFYYRGATTVSLDTTVTINDGAWHFVTVVRNPSAGTRRIYVDSVMRAELTSGDTFTAGGSGLPLTIGGETSESFESRYLSGLIDDVRIYARELSAAEVRRLYNQGVGLKMGVSPTHIVPDGLVGYWTFDGNHMGTTSAHDVSGNGNIGWLINGPRKTHGILGQALEFDGVNDYVSIANNPSFDFGTGSFTVSAWVRHIPVLQGDHGIVTRVSAPFNKGWGIMSNASGANILWWLHDGVSVIQPGFTAIPDENWHHIVGVVDRETNTAARYFNGARLGSSDISGFGDFDAVRPVLIGAIREDIRYHKGLIDEVRIYNRALSADEIKLIYNATKPSVVGASPKHRLTDGLVGYWTFDGPDMAGDVAYDRSGNNNNGTLFNGPQRTFGRLGQALEFDGVDDHIRAPMSGQALDGGLTVSGWFNPVNGNVIVARGDAVDAGRWFVQMEFGNRMRLVKRGDTNLVARTTTVFTTNEWQHFVVTWNGGNSATTDVIWYRNGVQVNKDLTTDGVNLGSDEGLLVTIGAQSTGSNPVTQHQNRTNGLIDDVRIYNRALSADEVRMLYNMGR